MLSIDKTLISDILTIAFVGFLLFMLPSMLRGVAESETNLVDQQRGCVASAYQATRYGHDLEANLKECNEL